LSTEQDPVWLQIGLFITEILKIFLGAFLGAVCAFAYERKSKAAEDKFRHSKAIRDTQFGLIDRITTLMNIIDQHMVSQEANPHRWVELSPFLHAYNLSPLPVAELSFLLDGIDPNLVQEVQIVSHKFDTVQQLIQVRNAAHDEFQRWHEQNQMSPRLQVHLVRFTDALYDQAPDTVLDMNRVFQRLGDTMSNHFRGINKLDLGDEVKQKIEGLQNKTATIKP